MSNTNERQAVLIILDGWGYREEIKDNAVAAAKTPVFDRLWNSYPHSLLEASGLAVGLPHGQMGNSEVGHTTIGAGKPMDTDLVRIGKTIESGEFGKNLSFTALFDQAKKNDSTLHVMGLVSSGGVHSHQDHLFAFLRAASDAGVKKIAVHAFTDGRDVPPQSAGGYLREFEAVLAKIAKTGTTAWIASLSGRFYAMDRDNNWDRLARVEEILFEGKGMKVNGPASAYVEELYKEGKLDEHLEPVMFENSDSGVKNCAIQKNDAVFFFNFRADRARMLTSKILEKVGDLNLVFATLTEYKKEFDCLVAFPPTTIETTLAKEISEAGFTQAHIAETEKFPHATYFLNGGKQDPHRLEEHVLVPSRKDVPTHDLAPKMRAKEIADKAVEQIEQGTRFIFINFANPDMVGHTANVPAIIEALEEVDLQLGRVIDTLEKRGGIAFITADHGNAEVNVDQRTGEKHTSHTTNPVPAIVTDANVSMKNGTLADIAPTILDFLGLKKPKNMTGESLAR